MDQVTTAHWYSNHFPLHPPLDNWALALLAGLSAYLAMSLAVRFVSSRAGAYAERTPNRFDNMAVDVFGATNRWLLAVAAALIGAAFLEMPARWAARMEQLWFAALALQFALWLNKVVTIGLRRYVARHATGGMTQVSASATLLSWGLRTTLWTIVVLAVLSNLGVDITAFVASLGVGGIAVALAVQNILGDLFASLSIAIDKPFEVGDAIAFGAFSGTVEHIGLKTTRIRSVSGEQVVVSNTDLLKQTVSNFKRMQERRVAFKFGVTYEAGARKAEQIPALVKRIVESSDKLRFDRTHLQALGESALDFEVVYYVRSPDYLLFMDLQQAINLRLLEELERLGVSLAHPTRTLQIVRPPAPG